MPSSSSSSQQGRLARSQEVSSSSSSASFRGRDTSGVSTPGESLDSKKKVVESPPRLPRVSLRDLERKEKQRERRELRELRRSLLNTNLSLRNLYTFLVNDPAEESEEEEDEEDEGEEPPGVESNSASTAQDAKRDSERNLKAKKSSATGGRRGKVLTPDEFWKLHETELLAHRMQPARESSLPLRRL